jgi:hypothetical protein
MKDLRNKTLARIFSEAKKRGISPERVRGEIVFAHAGKRLSEASQLELEKVLQAVLGNITGQAEAHAAGTPFNKRWEHLGVRPGMASPRQLRRIEATWMEVSKAPTLDMKRKALDNFLKRVVKVQKVEWIEGWQVQKILSAIDAMHRADVSKQFGKQGGTHETAQHE